MRLAGRLGLRAAAAGPLLACVPREPRAAARELEALVETRAGVEVDGLARERRAAAMAEFVRGRLQSGLTRDDAVVIGLLNNRRL